MQKYHEYLEEVLELCHEELVAIQELIPSIVNDSVIEKVKEVLDEVGSIE